MIQHPLTQAKATRLSARRSQNGTDEAKLRCSAENHKRTTLHPQAMDRGIRNSQIESHQNWQRSFPRVPAMPRRAVKRGTRVYDIVHDSLSAFCIGSR
jgi:hypothetical protein